MRQASATLETERLRMHWLTLDDAALMLEVWNDPDFVRYVGDRGIRTVAEAREALVAGPLELYENHGYGPYRIVERDSGAAIGTCGLFKRDNLEDPDVGFAFLPPFRRMGYAYEAAKAVIDHARDGMGLKRITAIVSPENRASIQLIERLGLAYERPIRMPDEDADIQLYGVDW